MKKVMSMVVCIWCILTGAVSTQAAEVDAMRVVVGETVITDLDINRFAQLMVLQGRIPKEELGSPGFRAHLIHLMIQRELIKQSVPLAGRQLPQAKTLLPVFLNASHIAAGDLDAQLAEHALTQVDVDHYLQDEYLIQQNQGQYLHSKVHIDGRDVQRFIANYKRANTTYHLIDFYIPKTEKTPTASVFKAHMDAAHSQYAAGEPVQAPVVVADLGHRSIDNIPDLYKNVVSQLQPTHLSYMVVAENGYHALYLLEKNLPEELSTKQVENQLFSEQAGPVFSAWLDELKAATYVKVYP